jgi:type IV secretory pathway VirB3-like protein
VNDGPHRETLFLALCRPPLTWGVPSEMLAMNVLGTFAAGVWLHGPTIYRSPFMFWLMGVPIHMALRRLTAWDYHWHRTLRLWLLTFGSGHATLESLPVQRARSSKECASSV